MEKSCKIQNSNHLPSIDLILDMLNEEDGALEEILSFYNVYIKNASKISDIGADDDLIQEIRIHIAKAVDLLREKLIKQKQCSSNIIIIYK